MGNDALDGLQSIVDQIAEAGRPNFTWCNADLFDPLNEACGEIERLRAALSDIRDGYGQYCRDKAIDAIGRVLKSLSLDEVERKQEKDRVAEWMIARGYATGHGDTVEDMLGELEAQARKLAASKLYGDMNEALLKWTIIKK
jgi:hypothetical protein